MNANAAIVSEYKKSRRKSAQSVKCKVKQNKPEVKQPSFMCTKILILKENADLPDKTVVITRTNPNQFQNKYIFDAVFLHQLYQKITGYSSIHKRHDQMAALADILYYINDCIPKIMEYGLTVKYAKFIAIACDKCNYAMKIIAESTNDHLFYKPYVTALTEAVNELRPTMRKYFKDLAKTNEETRKLTNEILAKLFDISLLEVPQL